MVLSVKLCFVTLVVVLRIGISYQECGRRFLETSESSRPKRIVGGKEAATNSWPWIVSFVNKNDNSKQYCSGSLIHPHWILTTAHCFLAAKYELSASHWKYIAGNHFLDAVDPYEQVLKPRQVFIHPKYIPANDYSPGDYDIALVHLRSPANVTQYVRPICLPNDTSSDSDDESHFVVGWGNVHDTFLYNRSRVLKELRVDIIPREICNGSSSYGGNVTRRQICAGHRGGGQDACSGDSGGPLQYLNKNGAWTVKGLVSWGRGCARNHLYGIYTDVKALLSYIKKTMQGTKCGVRGSTQNHTRPKRIVGGWEAAVHSWPWVVNIIENRNGNQQCGGSIIDSNWILTAAHCFLGKGYTFNVAQQDYHLGDHTLKLMEPGEQKLIPESIYVHPGYVAPTFSIPGNFDICLIKLKYSLHWDDEMAPVCLPDHSPVPSLKDAQCYVVGWGNVADTQVYKRSSVLKELRVKEVSHETCNSNESYAGKVPDTFFCAGFREGGSDTCYGDSGGPLQCDTGDGVWSVRGIVTWGIGCARPNYFGVYSNVSKMMPFVKAILSGPDEVIHRVMQMTVQDVAKQQQHVVDLCMTSVYIIMKSAHPSMTSTDLVRTLAVHPVQIALLKMATPNDVALAFDLEIPAACESMTIKEIVDHLTEKDIPYKANNDTLAKVGKQVNMTVFEMAELLQETPISLLLKHHIKPDLLRQQIRERRVIEEKVTRMELFASELTRFKPGCSVDVFKLRKILRNCSFEVVRSMNDAALKRVISKNEVVIFVEKISLEDVGSFFGRTWQSLRELRLQEILVDILGIPRDVLARNYVDLYDVASLGNTLNQVEVYWNISMVNLTLEKLLRASKLMEGISYQECGRRFLETSESSRPKRIVGGKEAATNSWPWIVSFVNKNDNSKQYCSGSLIHPHWILTTAHCFLAAKYELSASHWKYIAGNHFLDAIDPYEQVLKPRQVFIHPKYIPANDYSPGDYDIALVHLRSPANLTRYVRPICLPNDTSSDSDDESHFVVGWGNVHDTFLYNRSRVLKELRVDIIPREVCNGSSSYGGNVTRRQICAGHRGGGQDACSGDSGGPLQYLNKNGAWTVKGLVSWGRGCARNNLYGIYTDVKALLSYIKETMQGTKCGVRGSTQNHTRPKRIVGGWEAAVHSWPWVVNIIENRNGNQQCGGSIIDSNWILTAAHCFLGKGYTFNVTEQDYHVRDHTLKLMEPGEQKLIPESIYVHPGYVAPTFSIPGNFDICLIKLKYSLHWDDEMAPVCLPDHSPVPSLKDALCYAVGWGNVADTQVYKRSSVLKELRVKEVSHENCNSNESYAGKVPDTFFCAGFREGGSDTCYGDSGGPLQCDTGDGVWSVRGIVTWGIGCARPNYFGVYSNVSKMMPFVKAILSGPDEVIHRVMQMTVQDVAKQQQNVVDLCMTSVYIIMKSAHPSMTSTDLVRTLAVHPVQIALLKMATPNDVALAFDLEIPGACESMTIKEIVDHLTEKDIPYKANNDTLAKVGKQVNMTVFEMAKLLQKTPTSLLLKHHIKPDLLRQQIRERRVIEEKVTRMELFASELTRFKPGCSVDVFKLRKILRNCSFEVVRSMNDAAVKRVISKNEVVIFVEKISLEDVGSFFGRTWQSLRELRLQEILIDILGIPRDVLARNYVYLYNVASLGNTLNQVEVYWNISMVNLTLEKVLWASMLMEDKFECNPCHKNSVYYVHNCEVICSWPPCPFVKCDSNVTQGPCNCETKIRRKPHQGINIKLALILGVLSGSLFALFLVSVLICYASKSHRSREPLSVEGAFGHMDGGKSHESPPSPDPSNNNVSFLPLGKAVNGKSSSYVALECFDDDGKKCNGNLESIL